MILAARIKVGCEPDAIIDFTRPAHVVPLVLPDLAGLYLEHANKLIGAGLPVRPPANNEVFWVKQTFGPDGSPSSSLAGWNPEKRALYVREDLAFAPLLVSDVVAHEICHQIITDYPTPGGEVDSAAHVGRYVSVVELVAPILGLPAPRDETIAHWPQCERPAGFYGPNVRKREPQNA